MPERREDVWVYGKGKGCAVEVGLEGVVVEEGKETDEEFYGEEGVVAKEILGGRVPSSGGELDELVQVMRVITWQGTTNGLWGVGAGEESRRLFC